jgi:transcription elongation factor Elf1
MINLSEISMTELIEEIERRKYLRLTRLPTKKLKQWKCTTCGMIFKAGELAKIFVDFGLIWCRNCTDTPQLQTSVGLMVEFT